MKFTRIVIILLIVAAALLLFTLYPKIGEVIQFNKAKDATSISFTNPLLHQYRKGAHVYIGEVTVPTPCTELSAEAIVRESYPEQVTISVMTASYNGVCAQVLTTKKFKVAFQASKEAIVTRVMLNGLKASWTVAETPESVNLEVLPLD